MTNTKPIVFTNFEYIDSKSTDLQEHDAANQTAQMAVEKISLLPQSMLRKVLYTRTPHESANSSLAADPGTQPTRGECLRQW
jgi:hypothetical protein